MSSDGAARPATISDVADRAQVSRTTVSRYLSNQFGSMSPATKEKIAGAISALNYRPNRLARGLRQDRSFTLGFMVPDITNPFAISVLRGVESVAEKHGYMLMVCNSDRDPGKERRYLDVLRSYGTDGLLIFTTGHNDAEIAEMAATGMPIVLIDQAVPGVELDLISTDNPAAMRDAVGHLLANGYDDIGFFTDVISSTASRVERVEVFRSQLEKHPAVQSRIYEADVRDGSQLDTALDDFFANPLGRSRVIFAGNGVMMLKIYSRLKERGIRIPEDVSLIGFDDDEWARAAEPALTTIAQSTHEIGANAADRLLARIADSSAEPLRMRLPGTLIVRDSTRPQQANDPDGDK